MKKTILFLFLIIFSSLALAQPDLVPGAFHAYDPVENAGMLYLWVTNQGQDDAPAYYVTVSGENVSTPFIPLDQPIDLDPLPAGQTDGGDYMPIIITEEQGTVRLVVDYNNSIGEADETNNEVEIAVSKTDLFLLSSLTEDLASDLTPAFDPMTFNYSLTAAAAENSITFTPNVTDERVTKIKTFVNFEILETVPGEPITIPLSFKNNGQYQISFDLYAGEFFVGYYTVNIQKEGMQLSGLETTLLEALVFDPEVKQYELIAETSEHEIVFTPSWEDTSIEEVRITNDLTFESVAVNQSGQAAAALPLHLGTNVFVIDVAAAGEPVGSYEVTVTRTRAELTSLTENLQADFTPSFNPTTRGYNVVALFEEEEINITPQFSDPYITSFALYDETWDLLGSGNSGETVSILLPVGVFELELELYHDLEPLGSYILVIEKEGLPLSSLTEDLADELNFDPAQLYYQLFAAYDEPEVTFNASFTEQITDVKAYKNNELVPAGLTVPLDVGYNEIVLKLFNQETQVGHYYFDIERRGFTFDTVTENLQGDLQINPENVKNENAYLLTAGPEEENLTLNFQTTKTDVQNIVLSIHHEQNGLQNELNTTANTEVTIPLAPGRQWIDVLLWGAEGQFLGSYTFEVTKFSAFLSSLEENLAGSLSPAFSPQIAEYTLIAGHDETEVELVPKSQDQDVFMIIATDEFGNELAREFIGLPLKIPIVEGHQIQLHLASLEVGGSVGTYLLNIQKESLLGELDAVTRTGINNLKMMIGESEDIRSKIFTGKQDIKFYDGDTPLIAFEHDFDADKLNLTMLERITVADNSIIVKLSENVSKFLYIKDNNFNTLCVKDAEIDSVDDVSNDCSGEKEYNFTQAIGNAQGITKEGITCTDEGSVIRCENLTHSGIKGTPAPDEDDDNSGNSGSDNSGSTGSTGSSGGGGGGGGSSSSSTSTSDDEEEEIESEEEEEESVPEEIAVGESLAAGTAAASAEAETEGTSTAPGVGQAVGLFNGIEANMKSIAIVGAVIVSILGLFLMYRWKML